MISMGYVKMGKCQFWQISFLMQIVVAQGFMSYLLFLRVWQIVLLSTTAQPVDNPVTYLILTVYQEKGVSDEKTRILLQY